jgi:ComF family protein
MALNGRPSAAGVRLWQRALDAVFPPRCVGCDEFGALICETCAATMMPAAPPRCDVCWTLRSESEACWRCVQSRPVFAGLRSAFVYEDVSRDAVLALKFKGLSSIAPVLAASMAKSIEEWNPIVDAIVPVPLAAGRKRRRGYDQAEILGRELARATGIRCETGALRRRTSTVPQTEQPDPVARRKNVEGAFAPGPRSVSGGALIVDDVVTTGSTLDACARVLLKAGSGPVYAVTFARED